MNSIYTTVHSMEIGADMNLPDQSNLTNLFSKTHPDNLLFLLLISITKEGLAYKEKIQQEQRHCEPDGLRY